MTYDLPNAPGVWWCGSTAIMVAPHDSQESAPLFATFASGVQVGLDGLTRGGWRHAAPALTGSWHDWRGVTEPDWYWWWNGDEDAAPVPVSIHGSWNGTGYTYFATAGQLGWNRFQNVDEMGGLWCRAVPPELPRDN